MPLVGDTFLQEIRARGIEHNKTAIQEFADEAATHLKEGQMKFKIWSFEKQAWWKASGRGYTTKRAEAGVYSIQDLGKYNLIDWQGCDSPQEESLVMVGESEVGVSGVGRA